MNGHLATRHAMGLFDFSFMSLCEITGGGALAFLDRLQTRDRVKQVWTICRACPCR